MSRKNPRPILANKRVAVLVNPMSAGRKWQRYEKIRRYVQRKFPPGRIHTEAGDKPGMIALAKRLSLENDVLVVLGGDGTLADAMQGVIESGRAADVLLGVVPLGSGNAIRRSLGIPKSIKKAMRVVKFGTPRAIDLIEFEGRVASMVSVGATAMTTLKTAQSRIHGFLGHILASRILLMHPRDEMEIELYDGIDGKGNAFERRDLKLKIFDCVVNKTNHFGYNWLIAPKARIGDGYLDVTLFDNRAYSYLFYFPLIYFGRYQRILKHYKVKRIVVRGRNLHIQYNGEPLAPRESVDLRVLPQALRVIGPRGKSGDRA
jgi:diacylglycerol kinase (ATP)